MGQQYRNFYGQPYNGMPVSAATASTISNLQQSLANTSSPTGIPGVDPAQMAAAQQSLANPNAGDTAALGGPGSILPGPKELALGAVAGVGTSYAFNKAAGTFERGAEWIDGKTFGPKLASKFDPKLRDLGEKSPFIRDFMLTEAHIDPATVKGLSEAERDALIEKTKNLTVDTMQHGQLTGTAKSFRNRFAKTKPQNEEIKAAYRNLLKDMGSTHTGHNFMEHPIPQDGLPKMTLRGNEAAYKESVLKFNTAMQEHQVAFDKELEARNPAKLEPGEEKMQRFFSKLTKLKLHESPETMNLNDVRRPMADMMGDLAHIEEGKYKQLAMNEWSKAFETGTHSSGSFSGKHGALADLHSQYAYLDAKPNLTPSEKKLRKALFQLKERLNGIHSRHTPLYEGQAELTAKLSAKGVGPVGRGLASFSHYLQRVFNLSAMGGGFKKMAAKAASGRFGWGAALMSALMGVFVFGFSFQSAHKAKDGEKTKTFFHNLFGTGIASLIGWEFGRKLLESTQLMGKIFRLRNPLGFGFMKKVPVLKYLTRLSTAGLGTELLAMFGIGYVVQKVGEKVAHTIFGKPSQESIDGKGQDGKGNTSALKSQMPQQNAMAKTPVSTLPNTVTASAAPYAPGNLQARSPNKFSISPAQISQNPQADLQANSSQQFPPDAAKKWTAPPSSLLGDLDDSNNKPSKLTG